MERGSRSIMSQPRHTITMLTHITIQSTRRALLAAATLALATASHAAIVITLQQVGANVVETGSGSANLTALTFVGNGTFSGAVIPNVGNSQAIVGPSVNAPVSIFTGASGPTNFGLGSGAFASSGTGAVFGIFQDGTRLVVPQGYVSGTALSGTSTLNGATFASLGIIAGTYVWTWGAGATADSLTLNAIAAAAPVPEPGSALAGMLALGACAGGLLRRERGKLRVEG